MNLISFAFGLLCALGAAIFAAAPFPGWPWRPLGFIALGFGIALAVVDAPDPVWISAFVVAVAVLQLLWPRDAAFVMVCSGGLAGIWSRLLQLDGLPFVPALIVGLAVPVVTAYLAARRPVFAPVALREEALLALFGFGVVMAVAPTVSAGWRAATVLNLQGSAEGQRLLPVWVVAVSGASVALGGLYSLWMRR